MKHSFGNQKIAIVGFGVEGISTINYLQKNGVKLITVCDKKREEEFDKDGRAQITHYRNNGVMFTFGDEYLDRLSEFDVVVRSPGIRATEPHLIHFHEQGKLITSHTQLFLDACPGQVIGVTGTKGKGTTSSLIYTMLKNAGKDVYLGGNIGIPPLDFISNITPQSFAVLEMSSFQLQDLTTSPHISVLLMITSEHLDYHSSIEEYISAKRNILAYQNENDFAVINRDYLASNESDIYTNGKIFYTSCERACNNGCYIKEDAIWLSRDGKDEKIIDTEKILLRGKHNLENICTAVMAAVIAGVDKKVIIDVLKSFQGLEHRLELVGNFDGVLYYDDSFATTPESTIAAINSFTEPLILILGGSTKGADFSELGRIISNKSNIRAIIGIDPEWQRIKEHIVNPLTKIDYIEEVHSMKEIVLNAIEIARAGDVVLLSPACASFGMFKNYKERGNLFKEEVKRQAII